MDNAMSIYENKEIFGCRFFTHLNLHPTTYSLCHEAEAGTQILGNIDNLSPDTYYNALKQLTERNKKDSAPCRFCSKGRSYIYQFQPINVVCICTSSYCNCSCIYCQGSLANKGEGYNPLKYLKKFHKQGLFATDCYFDWGGGEPTLNPYFPETVDWIIANQYQQNINTNGILFSETTYKALSAGKSTVRISIDSGTKDCFELMKGSMAYDRVWQNVEKYCEASEAVEIKYNICNYNSEILEIEQFVNNCLKYKVKHIVIDAEVFSYQSAKNAGPFYFTEKELNAAHHLEKYAKECGLDVQVNDYAFTVRPEYNADGSYKLPSQYYNNIDQEIVSADIKVTTYPSIAYMLKSLKKKEEAGIPLVIWGLGIMGRKVYSILKSHQLKVT